MMYDTHVFLLKKYHFIPELCWDLSLDHGLSFPDQLM